MSSTRSSELLRRVLPCDATAPHLAREALAALDALQPLPTDALLVASELVTNAVLHSGCDASDEVEVVAEALPGGLRIEVSDPGRSGHAPTLKPHTDAPGGIGLQIVDSLARRWGVERRGRMRVWAELAP
ncbi:MAG: ATP-binding protein [Solirubrobacteraceae bacterium]